MVAIQHHQPVPGWVVPQGTAAPVRQTPYQPLPEDRGEQAATVEALQVAALEDLMRLAEPRVARPRPPMESESSTITCDSRNHLDIRGRHFPFTQVRHLEAREVAVAEREQIAE